MTNTQDFAREWQFTINNYTNKDLKKLYSLNRDLYDYMILGFEVGDKKNTKHIQGAIRLDRQHRFGRLKKIFQLYRSGMKKGQFLNFHREKARNFNKLVEYSKKDGNFVEFGVLGGSGSSNKMLDLKRLVEIDFQNENEILYHNATSYNSIQFIKNVMPLRFKHRDMNKPPVVIWLYGGSGVGKTFSVYNQFLEKNIYSVVENNWIGQDYNQEEVILFDDFRNGNISFEKILKITDRYKYSLSRRGSSPIPLNSPYIIFTSPLSLSDTFSDGGFDLKEDEVVQLKRRFVEIEVKSNNEVIDLKNIKSKHNIPLTKEQEINDVW